jgi:hypothetical protein
MLPLLLSSFGIGLIHALAGPDHYIPFIALAHSRGWSMVKTLFIASFASLLHVGSSVAIGVAGILLGKELFHLEHLESLRGTVGGYLLIAIGGAYTLYAIYKHRKPHAHTPQAPRNEKKELMGWALFSLFVLGPCEPLIPLLFASLPFGMSAIFWVSLLFSGATLISVNAAILLGASALKPLAARMPHSFAHLSAGIAILITGITMQFI